MDPKAPTGNIVHTSDRLSIPTDRMGVALFYRVLLSICLFVFFTSLRFGTNQF